jgi:hypothetical protein
VIVGSPPRCSAIWIAESWKIGNCSATLAASRRQYLDVERQLGHLERRRQRRRVDLQRIGLVAAEHEAAALVANVDVRVDHPRDRELGTTPGIGSVMKS